jgi:hypothetical protein
MSKAVAIVGAAGFAVALWYGWFWLDEKRRWAQPIPLRQGPSVDLNRCRRVL